VPQGDPLADAVPKRADSSYGWSMPRDCARSPLKIKGVHRRWSDEPQQSKRLARSHADNRLVRVGAAHGVAEGGVAEGEDPVIGSHFRIAGAWGWDGRADGEGEGPRAGVTAGVGVGAADRVVPGASEVAALIAPVEVTTTSVECAELVSV
jgi:hypothetical protein